MRALLRPLSTHTVFSPIETIVTVFVLATLAYFHILSGIKHSSFFESTQPPALRPAYARLTDGEWVAVTQHDWAEAWKHPEDGLEALELQQVVFTLDDKTHTVRVLPAHVAVAPHLVFYHLFHRFIGAYNVELSERTFAHTEISQATPLDASAVAQHLVSELPSLSGKAYPSICHYPGSNLSSVACFTTVSEPGASPVLTLSFKPGSREDWIGALKQAKNLIVDGVKYELDAGKRQESIGEMKSSKWVAYALSALVLRFWELTKVRGASRTSRR